MIWHCKVPLQAPSNCHFLAINPASELHHGDFRIVSATAPPMTERSGALPKGFLIVFETFCACGRGRKDMVSAQFSCERSVTVPLSNPVAAAQKNSRRCRASISGSCGLTRGPCCCQALAHNCSIGQAMVKIHAAKLSPPARGSDSQMDPDPFGACRRT